MSDLPNSAGLTLRGGKTGVLMIHGFIGSPISIAPWAQSLNDAGLTVFAPCLPGHGTTPEEMNKTTWENWYACIEDEFIKLRSECDRVFVAGFSMGGALALKLAQIRGSEMDGLILLNASIYDERKIFHLLPVISKFLPTLPGGDTDRMGRRHRIYQGRSVRQTFRHSTATCLRRRRAAGVRRRGRPLRTAGRHHSAVQRCPGRRSRRRYRIDNLTR